MRLIIACFFLSLLLLQFHVVNNSQITNLTDVVMEETATTEIIPANYEETFASEYLNNQPIENYTGKGFSCFSNSNFNFFLLTSGVVYIELRPPDQTVA